MGALAPHGVRGSSLKDFARGGLTRGVSNVLDAISRSPASRSVTVNSGYRSPSRNAKAGGASRSQHLTGNAVDLNVSKLSNREKQAVLDAAIEARAKGIGIYQSGNVIHVDARRNPMTWGQIPGAQYKGMPISMAPGWAQASLTDMFNAGPYAVTPRSAPPTPFGPDQLNPNNLRPSLLDGIPAGGVNGVTRSPLGPVSMPSSPAQSPSFGGALMSPTSLSRLSPSSLASVAAMSAPRGPMASPVARAPDIASMPSSMSLSPVSMSSTQMSPVNVSSPLAPSATSFAPGPAQPGPAPPSPASLASAYGQLGSTLAQAGVTLGGLPAPNAPVATPSALPAPNAPVALPVAPVRQPLPPPAMPRSLPSQNFPAAPSAPPSFSPSDIYGGQIGTATASDGNTVGRDPFGRTTVTNQYGVTTAMTPDGKQAAYGGVPGPGGMSSLFGGAKMSPKAGGILGGLLGAAAGTMVAGPMGGLIGGLIGKSVLGGGLTGGGFPSAPAMSNVDYANTNRVNFSGFGSGRSASAAEANRGGRGVSSGGTGLW